AVPDLRRQLRAETLRHEVRGVRDDGRVHVHAAVVVGSVDVLGHARRILRRVRMGRVADRLRLAVDAMNTVAEQPRVADVELRGDEGGEYVAEPFGERARLAGELQSRGVVDDAV